MVEATSTVGVTRLVIQHVAKHFDHLVITRSVITSNAQTLSKSAIGK